MGGKHNRYPAPQLANTSYQINPTTLGRAYSERGNNDNNKDNAAGFAGHGNQCAGCDRLYHRGDLPSGSRGASRLGSNGGGVPVGDVRGGAHNSASFVYIGGNLQTSDVCVADPGHARGRQPIAGCRNRSVST